MRNSRLNEDFVGEGGRLVDCPTQLTLMTGMCQLCFINLLGDDIVSWKNSL